MEHVDQEDHGKAIVGHHGNEVVDGGDQRAGRHGGVYMDLVEEHRDDRADQAGDRHGHDQRHADAARNEEGLAPEIALEQLDNVTVGQLQATGNMRTPGFCMVLMCALDVVFNALLIFPTGMIRLGGFALPGAGMGTAGAALGTGLAELTVGLYLTYFILRRSPILRLRQGERLRLNKQQLLGVLRVSAPVAAEKMILSIAQIISTAIVAPLSTIAIAAHSFAAG